MAIIKNNHTLQENMTILFEYLRIFFTEFVPTGLTFCYSLFQK